MILGCARGKLNSDQKVSGGHPMSAQPNWPEMKFFYDTLYYGEKNNYINHGGRNLQ